MANSYLVQFAKQTDQDSVTIVNAPDVIEVPQQIATYIFDPDYLHSDPAAGKFTLGLSFGKYPIGTAPVGIANIQPRTTGGIQFDANGSSSFAYLLVIYANPPNGVKGGETINGRKPIIRGACQTFRVRYFVAGIAVGALAMAAILKGLGLF